MEDHELDALCERLNEIDADLADIHRNPDRVRDDGPIEVQERLIAESLEIERRITKAMFAARPGQSESVDKLEMMAALAESFPSLRGVPGTRPWDQYKLDEWATSSGAVTAGSLMAARFVLMVWSGNNNGPWKCGQFDMAEAVGRWDYRHQHAFLKWARKPFYP